MSDRTRDVAAPGLAQLLEQLREASGVDFSSYKRATIERRLARRLAAHQLGTLAAYSAFLVDHPDEARTVCEDLLIHTTSFFRDGPPLARLVAEIAAAPNRALRIWVPGCATGEEVYSLAILVREKLGERQQVEIFGSDLSARALEIARLGRYTTAEVAHVSVPRLERFFERDAATGGYRVCAALRAGCVFARHDLVADPPFARLDAVSCRNVLIYLAPALQRRVLAVLHYALALPGHMLLGRAESICGRDDLFRTVDADARVFARLPGAGPALTFPHADQLGRLPLAPARLPRPAGDAAALSTHEDLTSSNEELRTVKEELQSTNEELETVNEDLASGNHRLAQANDDLENVLATVAIAIVLVDAARRIRRFTPHARAVLRLVATDTGRPLADIAPIVSAPALDAAVANVIATRAVHEAEVHTPAGVYYRMQIRPYRTAGDQIRGAVITFVDITALRAARERAAAILEAVPTPLVVLDAQLRVETANPAFYAATGLAPAAASGRPLLAVGDWRGVDLAVRLAAVAATGAGFDELDVERGGRSFQVSARRLPAGGTLVLGLADVTARRHLETARREFLDAVSHELRTPLSAIVLWAQALRTLPPDDPRRAEAIEMILDCADAEAHLVEDLLEIASSRSGELAVTLAALDPCPIVAAAVAKALPAATAKRIAIELACEPGAPMALDPRRLAQVVGRIVSNAIKFTPPGGRVWVELQRGASSLELRVRDTGPGIPAALLASVFEPFSQADMSSTRTHGGLGIGLALARHLVERHGGTITATSPSGPADAGTTITVRIPA